MFKSKRFSDLGKRLVVSVIAVLVIVLLIFYSKVPAVSLALVLTISALAGVGVWEYAQLVRTKGLEPASRLMIAVAVSEVLAFYVSIAFPEFSKLALVIMVLGFISFFVAHFQRTSNALLHVAVELFGVCYLAIPLSFMLAILYPFSSETFDGRWWLFYLIAVTKVTDVGGYFVGKLFGKRPLAPSLSPNKSIEGALGGFLFAIGLSVVFSFISTAFAIPGFALHFGHAIWIGMVVGVLAQMGDLAESLLKRDADVKDSNRLPGIGGVLDMLDSLLFTSPVVYFFIRTL